jgi:hypothetical protein
MTCAGIGLASLSNYAEVLATPYDDCGPVGLAALTYLGRALFLPFATLAPDHASWCCGPADNGSYDVLRLVIATPVLLFRTFVNGDVEPEPAFLPSVLACLTSFATAIPRIITVQHRMTLLELALIVLLQTGDRLVTSDAATVFLPLTCTLNRPRGDLEASTYIIPLFVHFFYADAPSYRALIDAQLLENVLYLCDYVAGTQFVWVMLRVLAHLVSLPELDGLLRQQCPALKSVTDTATGPSVSVTLQVALRVATSFPGGGRPPGADAACVYNVLRRYKRYGGTIELFEKHSSGVPHGRRQY